MLPRNSGLAKIPARENGNLTCSRPQKIERLSELYVSGHAPNQGKPTNGNDSQVEGPFSCVREIKISFLYFCNDAGDTPVTTHERTRDSWFLLFPSLPFSDGKSGGSRCSLRRPFVVGFREHPLRNRESGGHMLRRKGEKRYCIIHDELSPYTR